jgi:hypothetical protein
MRKHPITIALAIAGIIAGTHAGIAAIDTESTENIAEPVAMQQPAEMQTEAQAPADTVEIATQDGTSVLAEASVYPPATEPAGFKAGNQMEQKMVRVPFTNRYLRVTNSTFPSSANEVPDQHPAIAAYFDRRSTNIVLTGAPGPVFPSAAQENSHPPLPAMVAYWDRIEAQRFASIAPAPTIIASVALPQPTASGD